MGGEVDTKPENSLAYKLLQYTQEITFYMYQEGLLDRQEVLQSILDLVEKTKAPEEPLFRLLMPVLLRLLYTYHICISSRMSVYLPFCISLCPLRSLKLID